jgi:hypothetical protein
VGRRKRRKSARRWADNPPRLQPHSDRDFKPNAHPIIYVPLLGSSLYDLISVLVVLFDRYVPSLTLLCLHSISSLDASSVLSTLRQANLATTWSRNPQSRSPITHLSTVQMSPGSHCLFPDICLAKASMDLVFNIRQG